MRRAHKRSASLVASTGLAAVLALALLDADTDRARAQGAEQVVLEAFHVETSPVGSTPGLGFHGPMKATNTSLVAGETYRLVATRSWSASFTVAGDGPYTNQYDSIYCFSSTYASDCNPPYNSNNLRVQQSGGSQQLFSCLPGGSCSILPYADTHRYEVTFTAQSSGPLTLWLTHPSAFTNNNYTAEGYVDVELWGKPPSTGGGGTGGSGTGGGGTGGGDTGGGTTTTPGGSTGGTTPPIGHDCGALSRITASTSQLPCDQRTNGNNVNLEVPGPGRSRTVTSPNTVRDSGGGIDVTVDLTPQELWDLQLYLAFLAKRGSGEIPYCMYLASELDRVKKQGGAQSFRPNADLRACLDTLEVFLEAGSRSSRARAAATRRCVSKAVPARKVKKLRTVPVKTTCERSGSKLKIKIRFRKGFQPRRTLGNRLRIGMYRPRSSAHIGPRVTFTFKQRKR